MALVLQLGVGRGRREVKRGSAKMGSRDREPFTPALVELVSSSSHQGGGGRERDAVSCALS